MLLLVPFPDLLFPDLLVGADVVGGDGGEGGILIADGLSVGVFEGVSVGSLDRGEMVGDPSGKAGQNTGQALAISSCILARSIDIESRKLEIHEEEVTYQAYHVSNVPQ